MIIEESFATGVVKLYELGAVVILLVLINIVLGWFIKYLLKKNDDLQIKMDKAQEVILNVLTDNTRAMEGLREAIRDANRK